MNGINLPVNTICKVQEDCPKADMAFLPGTYHLKLTVPAPLEFAPTLIRSHMIYALLRGQPSPLLGLSRLAGLGRAWKFHSTHRICRVYHSTSLAVHM